MVSLQMPALPANWRYIGTSVNGPGYGYAVYRDDGQLGIRYAVRLGFDGRYAVLIACESFRECVELGERFADCWRAWNHVKA